MPMRSREALRESPEEKWKKPRLSAVVQMPSVP